MKDFLKKPAVKILIHISFLAIVMNIVRLFLADNSAYVWLNWNLVLALAPIVFAYIAITNKHRVASIIFVLVWLGFLPNAPYMITDFIHLADVGPRTLLWYDAMMMFAYSLAGILSYMLSLRMMMQRFRWNLYTPFLIGMLTGFGVYLGRYIRFNSWHVVTQPFDIIKVIGDIIVHPGVHYPVLTMTLSFGFFLTILYFISSPHLLHEKTLD